MLVPSFKRVYFCKWRLTPLCFTMFFNLCRGVQWAVCLFYVHESQTHYPGLVSLVDETGFHVSSVITLLFCRIRSFLLRCVVLSFLVDILSLQFDYYFRRLRSGIVTLPVQEGGITTMTEMITMVTERVTGMRIRNPVPVGATTTAANLRN